MSVTNNKELYSTTEFNYWANLENLLPEEKYVIDNFFDKTKKTIEAGTAGGRILLSMKDMGFENLYGFDYVPEFIEQAKQKDTNHSIVFDVQDATQLNYKDCSFDQIIYLQQMISSIEDESDRLKALKEAYRILKNEGTALFSFLSFEARSKSIVYSPYLMYLRLYRKLSRSNRQIQYLPWLKLSGKLNFSSLLDAKPYVYWYTLSEADQVLKEVGFRIIAVGSNYQIGQGKMYKSLETLQDEPIAGMLYFVCKK